MKSTVTIKANIDFTLPIQNTGDFIADFGMTKSEGADYQKKIADYINNPIKRSPLDLLDELTPKEFMVLASVGIGVMCQMSGKY